MKFKLEINLDDETECEEFLAKYGTREYPEMASLLGLQGDGAECLAKALVDFALARNIAFFMRSEGLIADAMRYEAHCDSIYKKDISPVCDCW